MEKINASYNDVDIPMWDIDDNTLIIEDEITEEAYNRLVQYYTDIAYYTTH